MDLYWSPRLFNISTAVQLMHCAVGLARQMNVAYYSDTHHTLCGAANRETLLLIGALYHPPAPDT